MAYVVRPDGAEIHYRVTGADKGPAVILGHGFFMDRSMFDRLDPFFAAAGIRLLTWDARGHGETKYSGAPFTYWQSAEDTVAVLEAEGIEQAVVGGLSQGGYAALRTALADPGVVQALVLMDTEASACTPTDVEGYEQLFSAWCGDSTPLEPLARGLAPRLIGGDPLRDQQQWVDSWLNNDRTRWETPAQTLIRRDSVQNRLGEISCRALVLRGEHDENCTAAKADALASGLRAGPVVTIPGAGHASAWTHPALVAAAVVSFVKTTLQSGSPA